MHNILKLVSASLSFVLAVVVPDRCTVARHDPAEIARQRLPPSNYKPFAIYSETLMTECMADEFVLGEIIAVGGESRIHRITHLKSGRDFAAKTISYGKQSDFWREECTSYLASLEPSCPYICKFYCALEKGRRVWLIQELIEGQTLEQAMKQSVNLGLETTANFTLRSFALQLITAIDFLHIRGLIHNDLKAGNLMLTTGGQLKVIDFGYAATEKASPHHLHDRVAKPVRHGRLFVSDWYSVGRILFELAYVEQENLGKRNTVERVSNLLENSRKMLADCRTLLHDNQICDIVESFTDYSNPSYIESIAEIRIHPWFRL